MDLASLHDELERLGIPMGNIDFNTGRPLSDGGFALRRDVNQLWHAMYFERGVSQDLIPPSTDEDAACRELLRNLRGFYRSF